jgi:hypothetical protein
MLASTSVPFVSILPSSLVNALAIGQRIQVRREFAAVSPTNDFLAARLPGFFLSSSTHFGSELGLRLINFPNFISLEVGALLIII